jgi:hypothetical protein
VTDLTSYIAGTANEIDVSDDGDGTITIGIIDPLIVAKGGTGAATLTDHSILLGSGTNAITALGAATDGQIPIGSTGVDPVLATITAGTGITITNGAGSITVASNDGEIVHNNLSGLQGGTASEYYHLTAARHTTLGAIGDLAVTNSNFIVGNGSTWVAETGDTARTSLGVGTGDSPTFTGLTLSGLTAGSVLFAGADGVVSEDNSNLFWDNTSKLLGIGVAAPVRPLDIAGTNAVVQITRYGNDNNPPSYFTRKARGSAGSESAVTSGDRCGGIECYGWDGDSYTIGLFVGAEVDDTVSDGDVPMAYIWELGTVLAEAMRLSSAGYVGINQASPSCRLDVAGTIRTTDTTTPTAGTGIELSYNTSASIGYILAYDRTTPGYKALEIRGSTVILSPGGSDTLKCDSSQITYIGDAGSTNYSKFEADGSLEFNGNATVWNDANVGAMTLTLPAASIPDEDEFVDEAGSDTGITTWAYAVGEKSSGSIEIPHDYKEGSDITFHIHWQGIAAPSGTDYVKWQLTYTVAQTDATLDAATTITIETAFDTQYEFKRSDFAAITGTNFNIGDHFLFTIERVVAAGDAYAGDALVGTVGLHYECDTVGSRQIVTK